MITTGEGGAIFTDDLRVAEKMRTLRDHGAVRSDEQRKQTHHGGSMKPEFPSPGFNFRMTEMQGAIGVAQIGRLQRVIERRKVIARAYDKAFSEIPWLKLPPGIDEPGRVLTFYSVQVWGLPGREEHSGVPAAHELPVVMEFKESLMKKMAELGVGVRPPMISLPHDTGLLADSCEDYYGSKVLSSLSFALPIYPDLSDAEVNHCRELLLKVCNDYKY